MGPDEFEKQRGLNRLAEERPDIRLKIQLILARLGIRRSVDLTSVFCPKDTSFFWLAVYGLLVLLTVASILLTVFCGITYIFLPVVLVAANAFFHEFRRIRCENDIDRGPLQRTETSISRPIF